MTIFVWVAVTVLILITIIILIMLPIKVDFHFERSTEDKLGTLHLGVAGLFSLEVEGEAAQNSASSWKPLINVGVGSKVWKLSRRTTRTLDPTEWTLSFIRQIYGQVRQSLEAVQPFYMYILSKVTVSHLSWNTTFGTGDAALTGFLAGVAWTVKSGTVALLSNKTKGLRSKPHIKVFPLYTETCLRTDFHCIFEFRAGHIIGAVASALWQSRQRRG